MANQLDTKNWKKFDLNNLTIQLPSGFELVQRLCIHYRCDIFKYSETHLVLNRGEMPYPTDRLRAKSDFSEATLKINELTVLVFQYSDGGDFEYVATIPSDQLGLPLVNLRFRSKDATLPNFAKLVLGTIVFKSKLKGPQTFHVPKACPVLEGPLQKPMEFEEIKGRLKTTAADELVKEIERRRFTFDFTAERELELNSFGASKSVIATIKKASLQLDEQTKVYEKFTADYSASDVQRIRAAILAGQEFLNRWGCDPLWDEQIKFIRPWLRRLESRINFSY